MERHALPGSDRHESIPRGTSYPRCHPAERAEVTVYLTEATDAAVMSVSQWLISQRLQPTFPSPLQGIVRAQGSIENLEQAFGVVLHERDLGDHTYRAHQGPVTVDASVAPLIAGVFGLDNRPAAQPRLTRGVWRGMPLGEDVRWFGPGHGHGAGFKQPAGSFTPLQVAQAYAYPASDGAGQSIALIELGGGYRPADLKTYWQYLGITGPNVVSVGVLGGRNQPGSDADGEVMLDIEVAGAIAPKSTIVCYFAPNSDDGFLGAVSAAIHDTKYKHAAISISWGMPESYWSDAAKTQMDKLFQQANDAGIAVFVASGDNGSSDGATDGQSHVDFPASSPHATGVGGTRLSVNASGGFDERVWNDGPREGAGGGGCSTFFNRAPYQSSLSVCEGKQGVPDVAGLADPETGYVTLVDGRFGVIGGTSAVAPLLAGLTARLYALTGKRTGLLNPILYAHPNVCRDVTVGSNGAYNAGSAWDACTGLGVIDGTKLLQVLRGQ